MIGSVEQPQMPPQKIAFILDGKVQEMLHTDERLSAIFLSNPTIVDVTDMYDGTPIIGWSYNADTNTISME